MRYNAILAGLMLAVTATLAGCGGPRIPLGYTIPAHTERRYADMSLPAFAADGSLYVMNGTTLLHYCASGQRLSLTSLPVDIFSSSDGHAIWPRAYATRGGAVFVTWGSGHIGLLSDSQQLVWEINTYSSYIPQPFGDGMLIQDNRNLDFGVSYLDLAGLVRWHVPSAQIYSDMVQVDEQERAYFCVQKSLTVKRADGGTLLQASLPTLKEDLWLIHAQADRVLLGTDNTVTCIDLAGHRLWQIAPPGGVGSFFDGRVLNPDRFVLHVSNWPTDVLLNVDGLGQVLRQSQPRVACRLVLSNESGYLVDNYPLVADSADIESWVWCSPAGDELWGYSPPEWIRSGSPSPGTPVAVYPFGNHPTLGADGRIYFVRNSILYALDLQGQIVWQAAGTAYRDVWVDESTSLDD